MRYGSICSGIEAATVACTRCGSAKPLSAFHRSSESKTGVQPWCRDCHNAYQRATRKRRETPAARRAGNLKRRYGMTDGQFADLLASQNGLCAICRMPPIRAVVDHDHATGLVRGILCHACNIKLPAVENDAFRHAALVYLEGRR